MDPETKPGVGWSLAIVAMGLVFGSAALFTAYAVTWHLTGLYLAPGPSLVLHAFLCAFMAKSSAILVRKSPPWWLYLFVWGIVIVPSLTGVFRIY